MSRETLVSTLAFIVFLGLFVAFRIWFWYPMLQGY